MKSFETMSLEHYLATRHRMCEDAIASELLSGNECKLACEKSALAEIIGVQTFIRDKL